MDKIDKIKLMLENLKMPALVLPNSDAAAQGQLQSAVVAAGDAVKTKKNQRISHCLAVTEAICGSSVPNSKLLASLTEVLFSLCDDTDPDIRLVASDCLNRIVRSMKDRFVHEFQLEIVQEIKRDRNPRSLRAALNLFAYTCRKTRSTRCRAFAKFMASCFEGIANRDEDLLYDSLATSTAKIFESLGPFLTDDEVKSLCDTFILNLTSESITKRRASAAILVAICQFSRNPSVYLPRLLQQITDTMMPNVMEKSSILIIGGLLCIREIMVPIYDYLRKNFQVRIVSMEQQFLLSNIIKIYEMCMILCNHDDHNVVTTTLELLQIMLTTPPDQITIKLDSPMGLSSSFDIEKVTSESGIREGKRIDVFENIAKLRDASLADVGEIGIIDNSLLVSSATTLETDTEVPVFKSHTLSTSIEDVADIDIDEALIESDRNSDIFCMASASEPEGDNEELQTKSDDEGNNISGASHANFVDSLADISIGTLFGRQRAVFYCARFLAYTFLLSGRKGQLRTDSESRISVKVLALNCINHMVAIRPEVFHLPLRVDCEDDDANDEQHMHDLCLLAKHTDPMIRCGVYALIGSAVKSILLENNGSFGENKKQMLLLLNTLIEGLKDSSNVVVRRVVAAISCSLNELWRSSELTEAADNLFFHLLVDFHGAYWLVQLEFIECLSSIQWDVAPERKKLQFTVLDKLLEMLKDQDPRVRKATVASLIKFVDNCGHGRSRNCGIEHTLCANCVHHTVEGGNIKCHAFEFHNHELKYWLEVVVHKIGSTLVEMDNKYALAGYFAALSALSERYKPSLYQSIWKCGPGHPPMLLRVCLDYSYSSLATDLFTHSDALLLASNLFEGCTEHLPYQKDTILVHCSQHISSCGLELLHHLLSIVRLYYTAMSSPNDAKKPSSPVSSTKKMIKSDSDKKPSSETKFHFKYDIDHGSVSGLSDKLLHIIQQSWKVYRSNLDGNIEEKFTSLLKASWRAMGRICFYLNPEYVDFLNLVHDIAGISKSLCHVTPVENFQCVRKILQAISGDGSDDGVYDEAIVLPDSNIESLLSFWRQYSISPQKSVTKYSSEHVLTTVTTKLQPIIVAALKVYTTTNDAELQREVLTIMTEVIKSRITYRLVDPDENFIKFFAKQVGFLAKIPIKDCDVIISNLFQFLVLLCGHQVQTISDVWKCYLDVDVVIDYCKGFYRSGSPVETHCIPALRHALAYICEPVHSDSETWYRETMRTNVLPLILNLIPAPEVLPLVLKYIQAAKTAKEGPLIEESAKLVNKVITSVVESKLTPREQWQHECILAMCGSCSAQAVPSVSELRNNLRKSLHVDNSNHGELQLMLMSVIYNFALLIRNYDERNDEFPLMVVSQAWDRIWEDVDNLFPYTNVIQSQFTALLLKDFIQVSRQLFELDKNLMNEHIPNLTHVKTEYDIWFNEWDDEFNKYIPFIMKLSCRFTVLRKELVKLLHSMECADPKQLELCLTPANHREDLEKEFLEEMFTCIIRSLKMPNDHEYLVHHMITMSRYTLLSLASTRLGKCFLRNLNESQSRIFWKELALTLDNFQEGDYSNVVQVMKNLTFLTKREIGIFCLKLLARSVTPYVALQVSHLAANIFDELIDENGLELKDHELRIVGIFLKNELNLARFPRLANLCSKIQGKGRNVFHWAVLRPEDVETFPSQPAQFWCLEENRSPVESRALIRVLASMKYVDAMNVFKHSETKINMEMIPYAVREVGNLMEQGHILAEEVAKVFSSKRFDLREKYPLAVATIDTVFGVLENFEKQIPTYISFNDGSDNDFYMQAISRVHDFDVVNIPTLLEGLGELFKLKARVSLMLKDAAKDTELDEINFISPQCFTFFLYVVRAVLSISADELSVNDLHRCLTSVGDALDDPEFMKSFNKKENIDLLISCVYSVDLIYRRVFFGCNNNIVLSEIAEPKRKQDYCVLVLHLFDQLLNFAASVETGALIADSKVLVALVSAVRGFARFDQLNCCILTNHFLHKLLEPPNPEEFPKAPQVPIEVLQTDKDGLEEYVQLMRLYGIGSKTQFEENWMNLLWAINSYEHEHGYQEQIVILGIRGLMMLIQQSVRVEYKTANVVQKKVQGLKQVDLALADLEPELNQKFQPVEPISNSTKVLHNKYHIDLESCVRSFIELFKQWLEVAENPPPLIIASEVIEVIIRLSAYFNDVADYQWMYNLLMKIYKELEREDDCIWSHLVHGIFTSGAKLSIPEAEIPSGIGAILDESLSSQFVNVSNAALRGALHFLRSNQNYTEIINRLMPHLMKNLEHTDGIFLSESRLHLTWELLLFIWIYGPSGTSDYDKLEKDILANIFTVLSPLSKTYISVRLLVLKNLKKAVEYEILKLDVKVKIGRLVTDVMKTPNSAVFFEAVKLFMTIFYSDFKDAYGNSNIEPEIINHMKEKCEALFQILKSGRRFNALVASKALPLIVRDFFPPFEILNRVISEFLLPQQKSPELVAPVITQVFEKARAHDDEMAMVSEWIKSSIPNFMSNADIPRAIWTLTFFLIGISRKSEIWCLLPVAELKRSDFEIKKLFVHAAIDYYSSLSPGEKGGFLALLRGPFQNGESPYQFLLDLMGADGLNIA